MDSPSFYVGPRKRYSHSSHPVIHSIRTDTELQAGEVLPNLANAYFIAFQDEISGLESLHQAIYYHQIAIAQARPDIQTQIQLGLGKVHLELMYYADKDQNAQTAIDQFEWVLKRSKEKEELVEASNYKTQALWWKHITGIEHLYFSEKEQFPLRNWAKSVATTYKDDATAVCYYAMSNYWVDGLRPDDFAWLDLAWCLLRSKRQSPPPGFHQFYFQYAYDYSFANRQQNSWQFRDLSFLISALEHVNAFAATVVFKEILMLQRYVINLVMRTSETDSIFPKYASWHLLTNWDNPSE
jgi:hypothetical protein